MAGLDFNGPKAVAEYCDFLRSGGASRSQRLLDHDFMVETVVKHAKIDPSVLDNFKIFHLGDYCAEVRTALIAEGHPPGWIRPPIETMYALAEERYGPDARSWLESIGDSN